MKRLTFSARAALLAIVSVLPVACSSGGSELIISEQNAQQVAMQGVGAVDVLTEMAGLAQGVAGSISAPAQTVPCDSGNYQVDIVDAAPQNELSTGDSVTVTYNGCVVGGITLNGTVSVTATEVTGTQPGPYSLVITANFQNLTAVLGGGMFSINGGFTVDVSSEDAETTVFAVYGSYFSAFAQGGGGTFSGTLRDFSLVQTGNESSGDWTLSLDATVSGSELGGTIVFETMTTFAGNGDGDPGSGELMVTGAKGSTLTLVALDTVNVQLQVDTDGDGTPEVIINTTWDALDPNTA